MAVIHILKDGTQVDSIRGHIVKMADAEPLYHMIHNINNGTDRLIVATERFIHDRETE